ncbi:MAG TPA: TonB-dependent receptor plug domain-containing protein, partial [Chitinophagaceae bacterium]|nr:TonB-dependent receptor plug domain-containing protein [Chitinophagaceae bacterium]
GDVLVISYVGYQDHELKVFPGAEMNIQLSAKTDPLDDVVVVAYGSQRKKDITGSVSVVNVADAKKTATYDVAKMLQGQVAGVEVQGSGEPGGYVNIKIRGVNSLISNGPLFVVDGVALYDAPFDFSTADIESVQILKDASSAALYGVRAAGGVVIITTKKGRSGPLRVSYTGSYGFQQIGKKIPVTDRVGYQKITTAAELNAGLGIAPGNDPSSPKFISNVNTDWQKEAFKTGRIQDHNVSFSGGSELASFNVSLGYFDQTGTLKGPQKYDRYTVNMSMQGKKGLFSYGAKVALTQSNKNSFGISTDHAVFGGIVTNTLTAIPTMPVYDSTRLGGYGGVDNVTQRAISLNVIGMNNLVTDNDK